MYEKRRSLTWPVILIFLLAAFILSACGTQIEGSSWPGITAEGDVVYVAYGAGVIAVDVVQEEQIWSYPLEASATLQFFAEPSVNEDRVVLGDYGASGGFFSPGVRVSVYALEVSDGDVSTVWTQDELARDRIVARPVQAEGLVFVGTADNFVLALEAETGELAWQFEVEHSIWSTPSYEDGILYVGSLDKHIYALDAQTGDLLWEQAVAGSISGQVAVGDELVYAGSFDRQLHALDKATGEIRWEVPEDGTEDWVWAAPALVDGVIYFSDKVGNVYAVDAETGRILWDAQVTGQVVATPVVADGVVFIASAGLLDADEEERQGALVALNAETGEEMWREATSSPLYTSPAIVGEMIVVVLPPGAQDLLIVFNQEDGDEIWRYTPPVEG